MITYDTLSHLDTPKNTTVFTTPSGVITKGSSVNLICSSDANPPVENYTWFKVNESNPVGSIQQYSITNISSEDGGQYYCEARNEHGADNSTAVSITVTGINNLTSPMVSGFHFLHISLSSSSVWFNICFYTLKENMAALTCKW